ncbi:AI-2E family transporter [Nocardia cyriacigeorgica]|uniref:AI-2E family transporter n=1 Tax=Nocardia cyriacigeorgica TaxID=135487 RepID=A0A6P1D5Q9_9NOCA|nr:AI-2E family transporter [Nocardia cyriacigeorgica]NEW38119.1 AI-2E family transporter [Nocardia cyriacigeorgica]NEW45777.1 AI-2E family transporter [Nocardia cyriacigeorgica]NEW48498.1 AI-2E family transporter [Nocardia cyriacigeorgica]NEW57514.1 AI-2E family transporter [Nocardia cyriacigeorgica]
MRATRGSEKKKSRAAVPPPAASGAVWAIPRGLIVLLSIAGAVVAIGGIKAFSGILGPLFLALMLTVAVQPIQSWAQRRGRPAWVGMVAALVVVYLIIIVLVGSLIVSAAQLATQLPEYTDQVDDLLEGVRGTLADAGVSSEQINNVLSGIDVGKVVEVIEQALQSLLGILSNLFFILALLLFMAFDGMTMDRKMTIVAKARPEIAYALETFAHGTRQYLVVSTIFGLIVAVIDGGALWLLGVPLPVLWALLSFITNYIPNIGFVIGLIPPALLALLEGGPVLMLWVIIVYCVINFVIQSIIQPKFVGDAVGLSVTVTFLSLAIWTWILGALGALLAIPLTLLVKALLLDIDPASRWVNVLISSGAAVSGDKPGDDEPGTVDQPEPGPVPAG